LVCIFLFWHNGSAKSSTHAYKFSILFSTDPSLNFYLTKPATKLTDKKYEFNQSLELTKVQLQTP
jgi:hypothetical protein